MNEIFFNIIETSLEEDLQKRGDITTAAIGDDDKKATAVIIAKQAGVLAGVDIAKQVFQRLDSAMSFEQQKSDGEKINNKEQLLSIEGKLSAILMAERTALNFLGRLSGIATLTSQFVEKVKGTKAKILDTRKTTPGWRLLEKYAVRCGGGVNHRMGLYDMFLLKENHICAAGGITPAVQKCREYMKNHSLDIEIEVETKNFEELKQAAALNVERIMLDNMPLELMKKCVMYVDSKIPLEASGNVKLENVRDIAETGVDYISTGAITHSAPIFDFSLLLD